MSEIFYHGSRKNLKKHLKPMGVSRHVHTAALYLTDSIEAAAGHAFGFEQPDKYADIPVYNFEKQEWGTLYIIRSRKERLGYVYETRAPDAKLVDCLDLTTNENVSLDKYKLPNVIGAFVSLQDCTITAKHVVDYDFLKNNDKHIKVLVLKKGKHFAKAIQKITQAARATDADNKKDFDKKMDVLNKLLDKYTENTVSNK